MCAPIPGCAGTKRGCGTSRSALSRAIVSSTHVPTPAHMFVETVETWPSLVDALDTHRWVESYLFVVE